MTVSSATFWDRTADKYSRQPISDEQTYIRKLNATQALMRPDMKVLEFGCGTGSTAIKHARHVAEIHATDISEGMISIARDKARQEGLDNIRFEVSDIEGFKAPTESYDMVLMLSLLHLLQNRDTALQKAWQLLKPGGYFISSTACLSDKMGFLRLVIPFMQLIGKAPYVSYLKADAVKREIEAAGFQTETHWTHGQANALFLIARKPD